MIKAKIVAMETYFGKNTVSGEEYIEHFRKMGIDSTTLTKKVFGRENISVADAEEESSLTMAKEAVNGVLKKTGLTGQDIDMIIYSSILGEYLAPPVSTIIHKEIGGKQDAFCYDMNVNCIGMTVALEHAIKYMSTSAHVQRVLLVGSEHLTATVNSNDPTTYGVFGDGACALILEQTEEECGLINSKYSVFNYLVDNIVYPPCGMKEVMKHGTPISAEDMYMNIKPFTGDWGERSIEDIKKVLDEEGISAEDIAMFCVTQLSTANIEMIKAAFDLPAEKIPQISLQRGYTGTTSPFMVLNDQVNKGNVKRGDYVLFWTIGSGLQSITALIKY